VSATLAVSFLAPAKLNISLRVFGKRPDGLHQIRSVMVPVSLYDEVFVEQVPAGISVEMDDPMVPGDERNSCHRAAISFRDWAGVPGGVRVRVRKAIPVQAGLGGGSSDAAATLKGLIALTGKSPPPKTILSLAAAVGADVPFFMLGMPALVEGSGDLLTPVEWQVPFFAVIVMPPFGLPTREGYERLRREASDSPGRENPPSFREWGDLVVAVGNDFESAWEQDRQEIPAIKRELREAGAEAAALTGSGSAVFGLFRFEKDAQRAKNAMANGKGRRLFVVRNI
jgi:4-diphosphocytidyl-2-C-methyl-D-erythritol kinase